jgi:hypothetical protein
VLALLCTLAAAGEPTIGFTSTKKLTTYTDECEFTRAALRATLRAPACRTCIGRSRRLTLCHPPRMVAARKRTTTTNARSSFFVCTHNHIIHTPALSLCHTILPPSVYTSIITYTRICKPLDTLDCRDSTKVFGSHN